MRPRGLSAAVAQRALSSLHEAAEVVLQFIEQTVAADSASAMERNGCVDDDDSGGEGLEGVAAAAAATAGGHPLLLAAVRVLARCVVCAVDTVWGCKGGLG